MRIHSVEIYFGRADRANMRHPDRQALACLLFRDSLGDGR